MATARRRRGTGEVNRFLDCGCGCRAGMTQRTAWHWMASFTLRDRVKARVTSLGFPGGERRSVSLIGSPDFDCVSVTVWPYPPLMESGGVGRRSPAPVSPPGHPHLAEVRRSACTLIGHFRQDQEVVTTEGMCRLPLLAIFVWAGEGEGVADGAYGVVRLDDSLDGADADFRDGFRFCHSGRTGDLNERNHYFGMDAVCITGIAVCERPGSTGRETHRQGT